MKIYTVKDSEGILGNFPGVDETDALNNMALHLGGYATFEDAMKATGEDASGITVELAAPGTKSYTDENGQEF